VFFAAAVEAEAPRPTATDVAATTATTEAASAAFRVPLLIDSP
jgi:hypothetical protein